MTRPYIAAVPVEPAAGAEARRLDEAWRERMKPQALSRVVTAAMRERYEAGLSVAQVAAEFGITRQAAYERLRRRGVRLRPGPVRSTEAVRWRGRWFAPTKNGYLRATTGDRALLHWLVWEEASGPIPPGHEVVFLDGDPRHCAPDNLVLRARTDRSHLRRAGPAKACEHCGRPLARRQHEGPAAFGRRRFCGVRCPKLHLRLQTCAKGTP